MWLDTIIGNGEVKASLQAALASGSLSHAVLLTGADGCGRGYAARCLAADYLYPNSGQGANAVLQGESPEVLLVEGEGKSGQITVERIRTVRQDIFHSALSAAGRVVLIKDAHRMAASPANALLKVLEEPPADALFILSARDAASLPQTIVSRCSLYPLAPVSTAQCEEVLRQKIPAEDSSSHLPALLACLYGGRIGSGLNVYSQEGRLAVLQDALEAAGAAASGSAYGILRVFARYEGRADGDRDKRDALLSDLADIFAASLRGTKAEGMPELPAEVAAAFLPPVTQARLALRSNVSPKIAFSALAVHLSREGKSLKR